MNNNSNIFHNVLFVIVLYKCKLYESESYISLKTALGELSESNKYTLFIYDNSPQNLQIDYTNTTFHIIYEYNDKNVGLSIAYEKAFEYSIKNNFKWVLLLDQDTILNSSYLSEILTLNFETIDNSIACIVPRIYSITSNKLLSPSKVYFDHIFVPSFFNKGVILGEVSAFNSCSFFNSSLIRNIKIFPNDFKLDNLDHFIYKNLYNNKLKILQLNSSIYHSLSIENFAETINKERYLSMVDSEFLLLKNSNFISKILFRIRLIYRLYKQYRYTDKIFFKITLNKLFEKRF
jgi:GT2 family glycosyltransferase